MTDRFEFTQLNQLSEELHTSHYLYVPTDDEEKGKNRYDDILPYRHTRITLGETGRYINANRVLHTICTQAPLEHTIDDFWTMVWEQQASMIVMLTDTQPEKAIVYWPDLHQTWIGKSISVTTTQEVIHHGYILRILRMEMKTDRDHSIEVMHLQYHAWPDHGVPSPSELYPFVQLVERFREQQPDGHPLLIHCSAGIGRTGTFLAILHARQTEEAAIFPIVQEMRRQRMYMVQTFEQYQFIKTFCAEFQ